jgi:hypothetical protein
VRASSPLPLLAVLLLLTAILRRRSLPCPNLGRQCPMLRCHLAAPLCCVGLRLELRGAIRSKIVGYQLFDRASQ